MFRRYASRHFLVFASLALVAASCGGSATSSPVFTIGAIPDQDPEVSLRTYDDLSAYLSEALDVIVEYKPATDSTAAVDAFQAGDVDAAWFDGLSGAQVRARVPGASAIAQRDIDPNFTSVFVVADDSDLASLSSVEELSSVAGRSLTFGSETSTSGRLMPQYFLDQAGVTLEDFEGAAGFSGSHDATISLVAAGTYDVGALNSAVWFARVEEGAPDTDSVRMIFQTPTYFDYSWVVQPDLDAEFGEGFTDRFVGALLALSPNDPAQAAILDAFSSSSFISTENNNYLAIDTIGDAAGLLIQEG